MESWFHAEYENRIQHLSNAANRFQLNFVKEMKKECGMNVCSDTGKTAVCTASVEGDPKI